MHDLLTNAQVSARCLRRTQTVTIPSGGGEKLRREQSSASESLLRRRADKRPQGAGGTPGSKHEPENAERSSIIPESIRLTYAFFG